MIDKTFWLMILTATFFLLGMMVTIMVFVADGRLSSDYWYVGLALTLFTFCFTIHLFNVCNKLLGMKLNKERQ